MKIRLKGIFHERTEDAPFIGALVCSINCYFNCDGCCNDYIKKEDYIIMESQDIINEILNNPFNKGIILAGLEWSLQLEEMIELIKLSIKNDLQVIVYTGLEKYELNFLLSKIDKYNLYLKYGRYNNKLLVENYYMYNVKLSSSNQNIIKI